MVAKDVTDLFKEYNVVNHVGVDDFSDKLTFLYTLVFCLVAVIIVSSKQYVGGPISCYLPTSINTPNFEGYITNYCWAHGTIPLKENEPTPMNDKWDELDKTDRIAYYQWVPFVLCLLGIMAYLPRLFWQLICRSLTGSDLENMMKLADKAVHSDPNERKKLIQVISETMSDLLTDQRRESNSLFGRVLHRFSSCFSSNNNSQGRLGSCLRYVYLFMKCLYLTNALTTLYILQHFLGFKTIYFGFYVAKDLLNGYDWRFTMNFPRITFCHTKGLQILGQSVAIIGQCALPINMLNEKIFLFLWFWYCFVLFVTSGSIVLWLFRIVFERSKRVFVRKYMRFMSQVSKEDNYLWRMFTDEYLRGDGVFLVRMIRANAGDMIAQETIECLWKTYRNNYMEQDLQRCRQRYRATTGVGGSGGDGKSTLRHRHPENDSVMLKIALEQALPVCRNLS